MEICARPLDAHGRPGTVPVSSPVVVIAGPTAVGKTAVAVAVASQIGNVELINADSRQVRRGCSVATCAATEEQLGGVRLHLSGYVGLSELYSVWDWVRDCKAAMARIEQAGNIPLIVGGTGLFLEALLSGWSLGAGAGAPPTRSSRSVLAQEPGGLAQLVSELLARDPGAAEIVDVRNPRRVIRALEQLDAGFPSVGNARGIETRVAAVSFLLEMERSLNDSIIYSRAKQMIQDGSLLLEIGALRAQGFGEAEICRGGIGYLEGMALQEGQISAAEAVERIARRTRKYAKAQRTWFRHHLKDATPVPMGDGVASAAGMVLAHSAGPRALIN